MEPGDDAVVERARALAPLIHEHRDELESIRRLPDALVAAISEANLFRLFVPASLGGLEADPMTLVRTIEALSAEDGAVGWNTTIAAGTGVFAGWMPPEVAAEVWGPPNNGATAGSLVAAGRACAIPGGYRVEGRWGYGSGISHSPWVFAGCVVFDGDERRLDANGTGVMRVAYVPRERCRVLDTWDVTGLRGTGSHDFAIDRSEVDDRHTMGFPETAVYQPGPLYRLPATALLGPGVASVTLGLARAAIDDLVATATVKKPALTRSLLRERASVQLALADAEAMVQAARLYLLAALERIWQGCVSGDVIPVEARTVLRLACWNAGQSSLRATDLMFAAGGSSAAYRGSRLERAFRDVHVAASHVTIGPLAQEAAGRTMLGLEPTAPLI